VVSRRARLGVAAAAGGAVALVLAISFVGPVFWQHQIQAEDARPPSTLTPGGNATNNTTEPIERWAVDDIIKVPTEALSQRIDLSR
jgi:hypothetical protein